MFQIDWKENALRELEKLESIISRRIVKAVDDMAENPFTKDVKKLKGQDIFRLRVGDYRVLFDICRDLITIVKVGHRKHIYDY